MYVCFVGSLGILGLLLFIFQLILIAFLSCNSIPDISDILSFNPRVVNRRTRYAEIFKLRIIFKLLYVQINPEVVQNFRMLIIYIFLLTHLYEMIYLSMEYEL